MRIPDHGAESLGAHCEGPFLSLTKNGIHQVEFLQRALQGFTDLEDCYGAGNLRAWPKAYDIPESRPSPIKMITAAPEVGSITSAIPEIASRGIVFSIGHSESTYEQASKAVEVGATMITHLFNAMRPLHHRNPGIFGVLGATESLPRPFFGIIADGIHLHPTCVKLAFSAHPDGFILITDAMSLAGLEDGVYGWTNGDRIVKNGALLTLEGSDKLAGRLAYYHFLSFCLRCNIKESTHSSITLVECVSNFLNWTGATIPEAIKTVTFTPAKMLGLASIKGTLSSGADADIVVLTEDLSKPGHVKLIVDQVWKFGVKVHDRHEV
jgi:N-acetylglucosamine-6-phosphate deacetylase